MLAAAGLPISELFDKKIVSYLDLQPVVDADFTCLLGRYPSCSVGRGHHSDPKSPRRILPHQEV